MSVMELSLSQRNVCGRHRLVFDLERPDGANLIEAHALFVGNLGEAREARAIPSESSTECVRRERWYLLDGV